MAKYQHFKGGVYEVVDGAKDAESLAEIVVYRSCETGELWVRTKKNFYSEVRGGVPRFKLVE